jgi:hypothetical protein
VIWGTVHRRGYVGACCTTIMKDRERQKKREEEREKGNEERERDKDRVKLDRELQTFSHTGGDFTHFFFSMVLFFLLTDLLNFSVHDPPPPIMGGSLAVFSYKICCKIFYVAAMVSF